MSEDTFNLIQNIVKCLKLIDNINLIIFLKNNIVYRYEELPKFYYFSRIELKNKISDWKKLSNSNSLININILFLEHKECTAKFDKLKDILFQHIPKKKEMLHKFIYSLIKSMNIFIDECILINKKEFCEFQFNFLEQVIVKFLNVPILRNKN